MVVYTEDIVQNMRLFYQRLDEVRAFNGFELDGGLIDLVQKHTELVDVFTVQQSNQLNVSKDIYLEKARNVHYIPTFKEHHFIHQDSSGRSVPVSPEGIALTSVTQVDDALDEFVTTMGSLNSVDAFISYREHEFYSESDFSYQAVMDQPYPTYRELDDMSFGRLVGVGQQIELDIYKQVEELEDDLESFLNVMNLTPEERFEQVNKFMDNLTDVGYDQETVKRQNAELDAYTDLVHTDLRRSPISETQRYEELLLGLYYQDDNLVADSGLENDFELEVDRYFEDTGYRLDDFYRSTPDGGSIIDDEFYQDFVKNVSEGLGLYEHEADNLIRLFEQLDGGDGSKSDIHKWLYEGFEVVYGRSVDANAVEQSSEYDFDKDNELSPFPDYTLIDSEDYDDGFDF